MARPRHLIKSLDSSSVKLINDNFRKVTEELSLDNFKGQQINTGTVQITQNIIQAPVITTTGSQVDGSHIVAESLTVISSNLGEATSGSLVVGDTNKLWLNDSGDGGLAIGGSVKASAPFRVDSSGNAIMESATVTGQVYASGGELEGITDANVDVGPYGNVRGGQTDFDTGSGFFLGNSGGEYKFSVGDDNNSIKWNGTNLIIKGVLSLSDVLTLFSYTAATLPVPPSSVGPSAAGAIE